MKRILSILFLLVAFTNAENYILETSVPVSSLIDSLDSTMHLRQTFNSDLFHGLSVHFDSVESVHKLMRNKNVINVWPVQQFSQYSSVKDNTSYKEFFVPKTMDTLHQLTNDNYAYKKLNLDGTGIKVGIIDSGIDYTHPALGGCFGNGCKVAYGYDLVGNAYNGSYESIRSSPDPMDDCPHNSTFSMGHGTFLSGIVAANDKEYNWTGVAPGVTLGMWKVYGCNYSTVPNDILMKALEMAYMAGMDVISLSLGLHGGWQEEALAEMANRIVSKGVHVIAANGNIGANGLFLPASPASGKNVISVGSTSNSYVPAYEFQVFSENEFFIRRFSTDSNIFINLKKAYRTFTETPFQLNEVLPIVFPSKKFNVKNDACKPITRKHADCIMVIHQGGCNPIEQVENARQAGAKAVIFYTDTYNTTVRITVLEAASLPVAFVNLFDGNLIYSSINNQTTGKFTNVLMALDAPNSSRTVSGFSSQGPTNELQLKPEIMGVGENVFSTLPRNLKMYGFRSGTSTAAPFVAGQIAILLQKKRVESVLKVGPPFSNVSYVESSIRQGAGMINIDGTYYGQDILEASPAFLGFNDTENFKKCQKLTLHNHHPTRKLFLSLIHLPSLTAIGHKQEEPLEPVIFSNLNNSVSSVILSPDSIEILPGHSAQVSVKLSPPKNIFHHEIYSGYIVAISDLVNVSVPYLGMSGNMKDLKILERNENFPAIGFPDGKTMLQKKQTGHFTIPNGPYLLIRLLTGTQILKIEILKDSLKIGSVPVDEGIPRRWLMRNTREFTEYSNGYYSWQWHGDYIASDNTDKTVKFVSVGAYQLMVSVLKVFGDKQNSDDWEVWLSPLLIMK
uniref:SspA n=1 Tax=Syzygites megalocarpus TaxID=101119 RepID=G8G8T5_9FUNG|nr:SspA [Syzygites megalocarpus]